MKGKVIFQPGKVAVAPPKAKEGKTVCTVLMADVDARRSTLFGEIVEDFRYPIQPRREISLWPTMRYVISRGQWVDTRSGAVVESAKAVYIVDGFGSRKIHYLEA